MFLRKNKKFLRYLDIETSNLYMYSKGKSGVIPILPSNPSEKIKTLTVSPMGPWYILSDYVGTSDTSDWLDINVNWEVNVKHLDFELWYFAKPFVSEAKKILEKPGRSYITKQSLNQIPLGNTDWQSYSIDSYPHLKLSFKNIIPIQTVDTISHSLMKWCVLAIKKSITNKSGPPLNFLEDLNMIDTALKNVNPTIPNEKNIKMLPSTGSWIGYSKINKEIEHLAILSGIINKDVNNSCAFSIKTENLFELMVVDFVSEWGKMNGYRVKKGNDDSSRIGINPISCTTKSMIRSLKPDVVLLSEDILIIVDAKYKRHYDYLQSHKIEKDDVWYDEFRHDLHQVLSYSVGYDKQKILFILTHPTTKRRDVNLQIWKIAGKKPSVMCLLPIDFSNKQMTLSDVKKSYFNGLVESINYLNKIHQESNHGDMFI